MAVKPQHKVTFHRNGRVSVDGLDVGEWRYPDPSGAPWARSLVWIFQAFDGRAGTSRSRRGLEVDAISASARKLAAQCSCAA